MNLDPITQLTTKPVLTYDIDWHYIYIYIIRNRNKVHELIIKIQLNIQEL